ncbi:VanZ family protein [bacterium]|nr:VanZ family protein [bacterium]
MTTRKIALIQYILFTMLVVATPFVVVTRYLQGAVNIFSHLSFPMLGMEIPYVAATAVLGFIAFLIWQRKNITPRRVIASLIIVVMIAISQYVQDLYGGMSVYDLQRNWHYVAYGSYIFFFFRAFHIRKMPMEKMILISFSSTILMSLFDETFQYFLSHRVFDVSDIAKDSWGSVMGLILVLFVSETYGTIKLKGKRIWKKKFSEYLTDPLSALVVVGLFSFTTVIISPLLTDHPQIIVFLILIAFVFIVELLILHFLQYKKFRIAFIAIVIIKVLLFSGSVIKNKDKFITYNTYGLTVYAGLPIPFFDFIIFPNGLPRLVDKKHFFNNTDKKWLFDQTPSILLIGSGSRGLGGKGFNEESGTYFQFHEEKLKVIQVIILETPKACEVYNRLRKEGKNVMFVVHNTC